MKIFNASYQTPGEYSGYNPTEVYLIAVGDGEGECEVQECLKQLLERNGVEQYALLDPYETTHREGRMPCVIARHGLLVR